jgi:hypothetical protein
MASTIYGSCLCGGVRFEVTGKPRTMGYCHCARCRKAGGSAFLANIIYRRCDFSWVSGEELVSTYQAEPPNDLKRSFCSRCGSYLGEPYCEGDYVLVAASTLDADPGIRPSFHEYVAHKAPWFEITDVLRQFDAAPDFGEGGGA